VAKPRLPASTANPAFGRLWTIAGPVRAYVRRFPVHRGKGWLIRHVLLPILPPDPEVFLTQLPGGGVLQLRPRETLGFSTLIYGGFESAEISSAMALVRPGTSAFDVGANVGIYCVALGRAVGADGRVVAIEPDPTNMNRLQSNLALNGLTNVRVLAAAAGERDGEVELQLADDPAYHSLGDIEGRHEAVGARKVRLVRLDDVWQGMGYPSVSFIKIDVEGTESSVLRGGMAMISGTHPSLLIEANDDARLELLQATLEPLGYRNSTPAGFQPWNHLFLWSNRS
jgi:FkbM family methyltransferase